MARLDVDGWMCFMPPAAVRSWLVRRQVQRWNRAAAVIQNTWRKWKVKFGNESPRILCFFSLFSVLMALELYPSLYQRTGHILFLIRAHYLDLKKWWLAVIYVGTKNQLLLAVISLYGLSPIAGASLSLSTCFTFFFFMTLLLLCQRDLYILCTVCAS